uniref:50S ribosomal protein L10 n=1 Tax=Aureoumbra lagunensis TaxID=44058 RepID=A0A7S3K664_9STRA|mmetsp:Transcript_15083/g.19959  ORF Transcript_15083/g.19959 Transcript_15083/m.19959 type:complete len:249 (+) Transcript_15083:44-790(+)
MKKVIIACLLATLEVSQGFQLSIPGQQSSVNDRSRVIVEGGRKATPLGRTTTPTGKRTTVSSVSEQIEESSLLFAFNGKGLDLKTISDLRSRLPENTKAQMVKNTLMLRAGVDAGWSESVLEESASIFAGSNLWIFSGEDMRGSIKAYEAWVKDNGLKDDYEIRGGFMEGAALDSKGVNAVIDLPTKPELMARLAGAINMAGPLGLAQAVKNAKGNPRGLAVRLKKAAGKNLAVALKISVGNEEKNPN